MYFKEGDILLINFLWTISCYEVLKRFPSISSVRTFEFGEWYLTSISNTITNEFVSLEALIDFEPLQHQ